MPEASSIRVLVVADDRALSDALCEELRGRGHMAASAQSVSGGLDQLRRSDFEVGLLDLTLPDGGGIDLLRQAGAEGLATEMVVLADHASVPAAIEAMKLGAYDYLTRPPRMEEVEAVVVKAAEKGRLRRENANLRALQGLDSHHQGIITEDPAMKELLATLERVASSDVPVLILGETGTGKTLVARTLHRLSPRAAQAFVAVDCAALPEHLVEGELFGQEKGAFAGALARKPGLFELADRGVLFLDGVGEIPAPLQARLVRALETREFLRGGGTRPVRADVRVVSASTDSRRGEIPAGVQDLDSRLSGVTLRIPPLRERPADLPLLARHFADRCARRKRLTPRALEALSRYSWPGNVRELQMLVQRAAVLASGDVIDAENLPLDVRDQGGTSAPSRTGLTLAEMEREYIETVLRQNDGHRGKTARALGIDPKTLYNKLGPERPRKKAAASS